MTVCPSIALLFAQEGEGGVDSPFSIGVGARSMAMGNAAVAFPDDASALFWNPAGMVVIPQKNLALTLTTLFEGIQYNFIGYVHPMLNMGTFGLGVVRVGADGIVHRYWSGDGGAMIEGSEMSYWWGKFSVAYARSLVKGLSLGFNLNGNRQVLGFYSTNGFGVDAGIHYQFPNEWGFFKNFHMGCAVFNAVSPRMKLGTESETLPLTIRAGLAKVIPLRGNTDRLIFLGDYRKTTYKKETYHVGMEYAWNRTVYLRAGLNNGDFTVGGGLRIKNFQVDYATCRLADPEYFSISHRFSLLFYIGKSIPDQLRAIEEQKTLEVQQRFNERVEADKRRRIIESLRVGKEFFENEDYFNARLEFSRVLEEDRNHPEAQNYLNQITEKETAQQQQREEKLLKQDREKEKIQRDQSFVQQKMKEAQEALDENNVSKAIELWKQALERDPNHPQLKQYLQQAETRLRNVINEDINRAKQLVRQSKNSEAYRVLDHAEEQSAGNPQLLEQVRRERQSLDRSVDFITHYQQGVQQYAQGQYAAAARLFQKALQFRSNHARCQELYRNALARAQGRNKKMSTEVKAQYSRGLQLYSEGRYKEALEVWEAVLEKDPLNIRILEAIEGAKKKLNIYQNSQE